MSDQRPTSFENYPGDPASGTGGQFPDPNVADTPAPLDLRPGAWTPAPTPPKTSRRGFVGLLIGVAAAGVGVSLLARPGPAITEFEDSQSEAPEAEQLAVGDYSTDLPDGWQLASTGDDTAVATAGTNRIVVRAFTATGTAGEIIHAAARKELGNFVGDIDAAHTTTDASSDYDNAHLVDHGKVGGKAARLLADVWVGDSDEALLVVRTITSAEDSDRDQEAQSMVDQLSEYFQ